MARRAAALVLLAVIALASAGVAYWVLWGASTGADQPERRVQLPTTQSSERGGAPEIPKPRPSAAAAVSAQEAVPSSDSRAVPSAGGSQSQVAAESSPGVQPGRYVRLEGDGVAVFTSDPASGGQMYMKRALDTRRLPASELRRLTAGFAVASEEEALTLIEGLSGTAD